jgi:hypothetical protein
LEVSGQLHTLAYLSTRGEEPSVHTVNEAGWVLQPVSMTAVVSNIGPGFLKVLAISRNSGYIRSPKKFRHQRETRFQIFVRVSFGTIGETAFP